ncbi:MAG TPA: DUF2207 domain-containing protein [Gemmatimonadaceae bacterium]|nr:DUF2207 domain-containing protein [Gemmatimonadaceae bacterium]
MKHLLIALAGALLAGPAHSQEVIKSYDSNIDVRSDGSMVVTENITVHAEGNSIRRGIYRDFPTTYKDRYGNGVRVAFEVLGVERNGVREPWFTERRANGVRVNTGNDDFLPVPADYTFTIRYRTDRQLGFFKDHDELYWNATGNQWVFPIQSGTVQVRLPGAVPINQMKAEAYTGPQGATGANYVAAIPQPGVATWRLTEPLNSYEGLTIALSFPKGLIAEPTSSDRIKWFFNDNRGVLVALIGLIVVVAYSVRRWQQVGRDPEGRPIFARYEPPKDRTPAGLRFLMRMGYDMRCFSSDILALAVAGKVVITREDHFLKDQWRLDQVSADSPGMPGSQRALMHRLFLNRDSIELKNTNAATMQAARDAQRQLLEAEFTPKYFQRNTRSVVYAFLIAAAFFGIGFAISGGVGIPAIIVVGIAALITLVVFARLVRAPTVEGRALMDEIDGLKLYLSVAERQELANVRGPDGPPQVNEERYEALLPYAVALEVEDAWTKKFTAAVGAAAAAEAASRMTWYNGSGINNIGDFTNSIGSSLSSQISSSSTPPGSSSGGGGGGSSGGGGGGGGGGGR